ncbi:hypothetical protein HMPREF3207_01432 [Citrobacter koseri]|nr:hypothetical protein HMPREF3207_01432 [Citrobacter koseri]
MPLSFHTLNNSTDRKSADKRAAATAIRKHDEYNLYISIHLFTLQ